ncbi:DNA polymerase III subunit chi, partial [Enterobacter hormaechei subsp. xiangfangensis]
MTNATFYLLDNDTHQDVTSDVEQQARETDAK